MKFQKFYQRVLSMWYRIWVQIIASKVFRYIYSRRTEAFNAQCDVVFINLDERKDRKVHFESMMEKAQIVVQRFSAVRPVESTLYQDFPILQDRHFSFHIKGEIPGGLLNLGQLGCYLSHREIIYSINNKKEFTMVFEDDVTIDLRFFNFAGWILQKKRLDWDILLFDCGGSWSDADRVNWYLYRPNMGFPAYYGTHAIIVRNQSKEKILRALDGSYIEAIDTLYLCNQIGISTLVVKSGLCKADGFSSDIFYTSIGLVDQL